MVIAQRIIKSKGSVSGKIIGGVKTFATVGDVVEHAAKVKRCFYFLDSEGNTGLARSIRSSKRRALRVTVNVLPK